jgi:hypothetical protein
MIMFTGIIGRIGIASVFLASGLVLASAAHADDQTATDISARAKQHQEEMKKGKSHEQARDATQPAADAAKVSARAKKHEEAMKQGKTHEQANQAAEPEADAGKVTARAKAHQEAMKKGKTHEQANEAAESK